MMDVIAFFFVLCFGMAVAQGDHFGEFPDYGDTLVGGGDMGQQYHTGNSGETVYDAYAAAGAAVGGGGGAAFGGGAFGGGGGVVGGGGGAGGGFGQGGNVGYNPGYQGGYNGGFKQPGLGNGAGAQFGQPMGGAAVYPMGGGGGGYPYHDTGAFVRSGRYGSNPNLINGARAQSVSASTVAGATIAVIVIVVIFAGIAFFVVKQRRSRIMIASV